MEVESEIDTKTEDDKKYSTFFYRKMVITTMIITISLHNDNENDEMETKSKKYRKSILLDFSLFNKNVKNKYIYKNICIMFLI